jgi:hypothetical protein
MVTAVKRISVFKQLQPISESTKGEIMACGKLLKRAAERMSKSVR